MTDMDLERRDDPWGGSHWVRPNSKLKKTKSEGEQKTDLDNPDFRAQVDKHADENDPNVGTHTSRTTDAYED